MLTSLTDEQMIRQYLSSQPDECFKVIYNRYVKKVYRRCLSMTKDSAKAQDFTHDIFLKVFDKLDRFQERSAFSTWLYSIAYNYCSDQLRQAKRFQLSTMDENLPYASTETDESQVHEESIQLVNRLMLSLSDREQALLRLKYEEGVSIEELALKYEVSESAIKMRLKRARQKVQTVYTQQYQYLH
ncbi:RNA polymerase sigma factor [Spirosoma daeguense]